MHKRKWLKLTTGVIGLRYIFEVLIRGGDVNLAIELISRPDAPSYGAMITRGATALCESLDINGLNESENHHFLGDIIRVFVSLIAGLRVKSPNSFDFEPTVADNLDYAKSEYDFVFGKALCGYEKQDEKIKFYAEVPNGVMGRFIYGDKLTALHEGYNEFIV